MLVCGKSDFVPKVFQIGKQHWRLYRASRNARRGNCSARMIPIFQMPGVGVEILEIMPLPAM
jgi:hypothetical protein